MMTGLVVKDIRILLQRKQQLLLFVVLAVMLGFTQGGTFILGYLPLLILILAISTIAYDELDNGYTFLLTLPIDVKTYVREKYVFCGGAGIVAWVVSVIIYYISGMMHDKSVNLLEELPMLFAFLAVIAVMMAFSIPVQIRFGANGSRMVILVVFGVALLLVFLIKKVVDAETLAAIQKAFDQISATGICLLVIGVVCLSLVISYICSLRAMKKMEL